MFTSLPFPHPSPSTPKLVLYRITLISLGALGALGDLRAKKSSYDF